VSEMTHRLHMVKPQVTRIARGSRLGVHKTPSPEAGGDSVRRTRKTKSMVGDEEIQHSLLTIFG